MSVRNIIQGVVKLEKFTISNMKQNAMHSKWKQCVEQYKQNAKLQVYADKANRETMRRSPNHCKKTNGFFG